MTSEEKIAVSNSSNIESYAYSPARGVLTIEFKNGATWEYERVPESIFTDMKSAASTGKYFFERVKGYFDSRRIK
jgi:hypothetical protein